MLAVRIVDVVAAVAIIGVLRLGACARVMGLLKIMIIVVVVVVVEENVVVDKVNSTSS